MLSAMPSPRSHKSIAFNLRLEYARKFQMGLIYCTSKKFAAAFDLKARLFVTKTRRMQKIGFFNPQLLVAQILSSSNFNGVAYSHYEGS